MPCCTIESTNPCSSLYACSCIIFELVYSDLNIVVTVNLIRSLNFGSDHKKSHSGNADFEKKMFRSPVVIETRFVNKRKFGTVRGFLMSAYTFRSYNAWLQLQFSWQSYCCTYVIVGDNRRRLILYEKRLFFSSFFL